MTDTLTANKNWQRYLYARDAGHTGYCEQARRCEQMYLGGGLQWTEADREVLREQGRPAYEVNEILPGVNAALGYQINNRADISFRPKGGAANSRDAEALSKMAMQIADNNRLHWLETQVCGDGFIQQRGYFEIRMAFDDSLRGEIHIDVLDPMDVIPDPNAQGYSPDDWQDVIVTRWLTYDEIEQRYGVRARKTVERSNIDEDDFGETDGGVERASFAGPERITFNEYNTTYGMDGENRVRIVDRQKFEYAMTRVAVTDSGDIRDVEGLNDERLAELEQQGAIITKLMKRRVRWIVSTHDDVLHDSYSPYPFFTVVPFFPYFRRGQTRGMVDNAIGPQEALNKAISQFVHIVNTAANSGWAVQQNSLTNMDTDDLEAHGATTGVVIEYREGAEPPDKIRPNPVPTGIDRMIDRAALALKEVTVPDAMRGLESGEKSGVAIQSRQFAAQQQLAVALDNLARTRHTLAQRILWLVQHFYDDERVIRITHMDEASGKEVSEEMRLNQWDERAGRVLNNLTAGEYDVVITEQPMQVTFDSTQYEQALDMRDRGIPIPDDVIIRHSSLYEKGDLLQRMAQQSEQQDPVQQADVQLKQAQAGKTQADTQKTLAEVDKTKAETDKSRREATNTGVESQYSAIQTAQAIAEIPQAAPLADSLLKSAGYKDADAAPIVPDYRGPAVRSVPGSSIPATVAGSAAEGGIDVIPENTNPLTPSNPDRGMNAGIEGGDED